MSTPHFSEDEVHTIFEQAALRQEEARRAEDASRAGLSLDELQRIGAESGIDPAHVAAAAAALRSGRPAVEAEEKDTLLGMPTRLRRTRYLPVPVTDAVWEQTVAELRRIFEEDGVASEVGRIREWVVHPARGRHDRSAKVTLAPDGDGTRVEIEQVTRSTVLGLLAGSATYAVMLLLFSGLSAFASFEGGLMLVALFAVLTILFFGGSLFGMRAYGRRQEERFERALDRIELLARDAAHSLAAEAPDAAEAPNALPNAAPRLDLEALPEAPNPEPVRREKRRERH